MLLHAPPTGGSHDHVRVHDDNPEAIFDRLSCSLFLVRGNAALSGESPGRRAVTYAVASRQGRGRLTDSGLKEVS